MIMDSDTLEAAAIALEQRHGNLIYRQAWRTGAKMLRAMKPKMLMGNDQVLTDKPEQISSLSSPCR